MRAIDPVPVETAVRVDEGAVPGIVLHEAFRAGLVTDGDLMADHPIGIIG